MTELIRTEREPDQIQDQNTHRNYILFEKIDRAKFEVLHPEGATQILGMVSRTIYKKIKEGELLYTLEKGVKRVVIPKDQIVNKERSEQALRESEMIPNEKAHDRNQTDRTSDLVDRVLNLSEQLLEKDRLIHERDQTISTLNNQLQNAHTALQKRNLPEPLDPREKEVETLKALLNEIYQAQQTLRPHKPWWKFWS
jgi:hypothetical protein